MKFKLNEKLEQEILNLKDLDLEGWDTEFEVALTINSLIKMVEAKKILEIGTYRGITTLFMAEAIQDLNGEVITIDIKNYAETNFEKSTFKNLIRYKIGNSQKILSKSNMNFDLIFIDADHSEQGVFKDFNITKKYLNDDGIIIFHDSNSFKGVKNVINYIKHLNNFQVIDLKTPKRNLKNNIKYTGISIIVKKRKYLLPRFIDLVYILYYNLKIFFKVNIIKFLKFLGFKESDFKFKF